MADTPALTTTFTPPTSCLTQIYLETDSGIVANVLGNVRDTASCLPDAIDPLRTSFFSPGLYCPSGYTEACSTTIILGSAKETRATCCPTGGFDCKTSAYWPFDSSYGCDYYYPTTTVVTATKLSSGAYYTTLKTMSGGWDYLNAFGIQIRWQSTDLATLMTSSSSSSRTTAAATSSTSTKSASSHSSGLSTDGQLRIGLGVGISGGVVIGALLVLGIMWWRRRKTRASGRDSATAISSHPQAAESHLYHGATLGAPKYGVPRIQELDGRGHIPEISGSYP